MVFSSGNPTNNQQPDTGKAEPMRKIDNPLKFKIHSAYNADCYYTAAGQIIFTAYVERTDTQPPRAFFNDVCRGIDGVIDLTARQESMIEQDGFRKLHGIIQGAYLRNENRGAGWRSDQEAESFNGVKLDSEEEQQEYEAIERVCGEHWQRSRYADTRYQMQNIYHGLRYHMEQGNTDKVAEKMAALAELAEIEQE